MPQIRLEQVSKYYQQEKKAVPAVREIDLTIEQQEFVFVTGSSGAGKSTLLNLIAGEITPTAGAVYLDNVPIGQQRRFGHPRKAGCSGYVPQISRLMRKRTIEENLAMASMIGRGRRKVPMEERIRKALCMVGLRMWRNGIRWNYHWESAAGWSWPGPSSTAHPCWCWTNLPQVWTRTLYGICFT